MSGVKSALLVGVGPEDFGSDHPLAWAVRGPS